jgi:hypothetical protein
MEIFGLLLIAFLIWLFSSKKSRRASVIETRLEKMIAGGVSDATFEDVYYEAAHNYGISKGASPYDRNSIGANVLINQQTYFVSFSRSMKGGLSICVHYK